MISHPNQLEPEGQEAWSLGKGTKWMSEKRFSTELGMSTQGFRKWCRWMGVPMIEKGPRTRMVNVFMFKVAVWAISRIGQPNFVLPGSQVLGKSKKQQAMKNRTQYLDAAYLRDNLADIVEEMILARKLEGAREMRDIRELAMDAADRMIAANIHLAPKEALERRDMKNAQAN